MKIKTKDILIALRQTLPLRRQKYARIKIETWCGRDKCEGCGIPIVLPDEIEIPDESLIKACEAIRPNIKNVVKKINKDKL